MSEKVGGGAGSEESECAEDVLMVRLNLKTNGGVVLNPSGLNVEYFEASVMRGVWGMLHGKVGVLRNGETKAWRGKLRPRKWRRWGWEFWLCQCRWHASKESSLQDGQGHSRDEFEWR